MNRFEKLVASRQKAIKSDIQLTTLRRCVEDTSSAPKNIQGISMTRWIQKYYPVGKKKTGEFLNSPWAMIMASVLGIGTFIQLIDLLSQNRTFSKKLIEFTGQAQNFKTQNAWSLQLQMFTANLTKFREIFTATKITDGKDQELQECHEQLGQKLNEIDEYIQNSESSKISQINQKSFYQIFNDNIHQRLEELKLIINQCKLNQGLSKEQAHTLQIAQIKRIEVFTDKKKKIIKK